METTTQYHKNNFPSHLNQTKIGVLIALLAKKISDLCLTKLLKILYLIDETSVKETGLVVTDIRYKVWIKGPVAVPVYYDLIHSDSVFKNYFDVETVAVKNSKKRRMQITPKKGVELNNDEFSDYELELVDRIVEEYGNWSATKLVRHLHKEGSAWKKVVDENDLENVFKTEITVTNYPIEFSDLLKDSPHQHSVFTAAAASRRF